MPKASRRVSPHDRNGHAPDIATLSVEEASAALSALANGRQHMPPLDDIRAMVKRRKSHAVGARKSAAAGAILLVAILTNIDLEGVPC